MHKHQWVNQVAENNQHKEGNKYISFSMIQTCDCGVYRLKEFIHIEDFERLENKGDAK